MFGQRILEQFCLVLGLKWWRQEASIRGMEAVGRSVVVELAGEVGRDLVLPVSSSNTTSPLLKMRSINVCETCGCALV